MPAKPERLMRAIREIAAARASYLPFEISDIIRTKTFVLGCIYHHLAPGVVTWSFRPIEWKHPSCNVYFITSQDTHVRSLLFCF